MNTDVIFVNIFIINPCFQIPSDGFIKNPNLNQNVYLKAQFPDTELEKVVLVSFQSSYIYIQTDKTLYTPNSKGVYGVPGHKSHLPLLENILQCLATPSYGLLQTTIAKVMYFFFSVHYRMFAVTPRMEPLERNDGTPTDTIISIEIEVLYLIWK